MTDTLLALIAVELGVVVAYIVFTMTYSMYSVFVADKKAQAQEQKRYENYMKIMQAKASNEIPTEKDSPKRGHYI